MNKANLDVVLLY